MNIIYKTRSTNGRWGVDIVSTSYGLGPHPIHGREAILAPAGEPCDFPLRGRISDLGEVDGVRVFRIEHDPEAPTWLAFGQVVSGGTQILSMSLQSHRELHLAVIGPAAILRREGYRGRWSETFLVREGVEQDLSPSQLLALGLIEPDQAPQSVDPVQALPLETEMARKLRALNL